MKSLSLTWLKTWPVIGGAIGRTICSQSINFESYLTSGASEANVSSSPPPPISKLCRLLSTAPINVTTKLFPRLACRSELVRTLVSYGNLTQLAPNPIGQPSFSLKAPHLLLFLHLSSSSHLDWMKTEPYWVLNLSRNFLNGWVGCFQKLINWECSDFSTTIGQPTVNSWKPMRTFLKLNFFKHTTKPIKIWNPTLLDPEYHCSPPLREKVIREIYSERAA